MDSLEQNIVTIVREKGDTRSTVELIYRLKTQLRPLLQHVLASNNMAEDTVTGAIFLIADPDNNTLPTNIFYLVVHLFALEVEFDPAVRGSLQDNIAQLDRTITSVTDLLQGALVMEAIAKPNGLEELEATETTVKGVEELKKVLRCATEEEMAILADH